MTKICCKKNFLILLSILLWKSLLLTTSFLIVPMRKGRKITSKTTVFLVTPSFENPALKNFAVESPIYHKQKIHVAARRRRRNSFSSLNMAYGELRRVDSQLMFDTFEWCANLGAPAALVAAAVLATISEDASKHMRLEKSDSRATRIRKILFRFLVVSSFGLEITSIFVTTVTGTMLLSYGDQPASILPDLGTKYNSPMGLLKHIWEFEYLTGRIAFIQGLFHWLGSVVLQLSVPQKGESVTSRRMNKFTAAGLSTAMIAMLSFFNRHMTYYENYADMLHKYCKLLFRNFIWPPKPLTFLMMPMSVITFIFGYQVLVSTTTDEDGKNQ